MVLGKRGLRSSLSIRSRRVPASQRVSRSAVRSTRSGKRSPLSAPPRKAGRRSNKAAPPENTSSEEVSPKRRRGRRKNSAASKSKSSRDKKKTDEEEDESSSEEQEEDASRRTRRLQKTPKSPAKGRPPAKRGTRAVKNALESSWSSSGSGSSSASSSEEEEEEDEESSPAKAKGKTPQTRRLAASKSKKRNSSEGEEAAVKARRGRPPSKKPPPSEESSSEEEDSSPKTSKKVRRGSKRGKASGRLNEDSSTEGGPSPPKKRNITSRNTSQSSDEEDEEKTKRKTRGNPRSKKRVSKVKLAQMKLKQMQNLGAWGTPPRRAASLNAAAMVTCLYDWDAHRNTTTSGGSSSANSSPGIKKPPKGKSEKSSESDKSATSSPESRKVMSKNVKKVTKEEGGARSKKSAPPPSGKAKVGRKKKVILPQSSSSSSSESEEDSEEPKVNSVAKSPSKKKKSLKDEFKMDIKDMIVKKRIASLNASAIMTASYGNYDANKPLKEDSSPKKESPVKDKLTSISDVGKKSKSKEAVLSKKPEEKKTPKRPPPVTSTPSKKIASFKKETTSLLPPKKNKSKVADTIIVEIQDEDIKNQLIASAMKKAGKHHQALEFGKKSSALPPKKRAIHESSSSSTALTKFKKKRASPEKIVYEDDEDEEEIETITTEGAARSAAEEEASSIQAPIALNTEMNKMDLVIDGRVVHQGMYQVVHRFETISTTTALMNRDQQNNRESQDGSRKFAAPLGAIASLQTAASSNPPGERLSTGPFIGSASTAHSLAGYYQPTGPLLRASSPVGTTTTVVSSAPPTATVQPTVLSSSGGKRAPSPEKEDSRSSPLKPTPTALPHPYYHHHPYGVGSHFSPYPHPNHQYFDPNAPPPSHPMQAHHPLHHPQMPPTYTPYHPYPVAAATTHHHPGYRGHPTYPLGSYYPFQGGYYLTPNPAPLAFPPGHHMGGGPPSMAPQAVIEQHSSRPSLSSTCSGSTVTTSSTGPATATHQVTLQGTSSSFNYATLGQSPYSSGGRIIAPIFALAPPPSILEHPSPAPPNPLYPYTFPNLSAHTNNILAPSAASAGVVTSIAEASKNELAGSQKVGKGPDSQNTHLPTQAVVKKKEKKTLSKGIVAPPPPALSTLVSSSLTSFNSSPSLSNTTTHTSIPNSGNPKSSPAIASSINLSLASASTTSPLLARSGAGTLAVTSSSSTNSCSSSSSSNSKALKEPRKPSKKREDPGGSPQLKGSVSPSRKKLQLPKGLVITEIESPPVLHIPEPLPPPPKAKEVKRGHPGLPNGLLRMATTSVQNNHHRSSSSNNGQATHGGNNSSSITRVTPKDLKSKIALYRIGLMNQEEQRTTTTNPSLGTAIQGADKSTKNTTTASNCMINNRICLKPPRLTESDKGGGPLKKLKRKKDYDKCSPISMSMAQCAVSAVLKSQGAPPKLIHKSCPKSPIYPAKGGGRSLSTPTNGSNSSSSSRSSSRNSSLSPRERILGGGGSNSCGPSSKASPKHSKHSSLLLNGGNAGGVLALSNNNSPLHAKRKALPPIPSTSLGTVSSKKHRGPPRLSNGWSWVGECTEQKVYLNNEDPPALRNCYSSMKHTEGDVVKVRDCILLASGNRKKDLPFIAKVTSLWEHPDNGEMMLSLLWYYRPEHLDNGRNNYELSDEIYASKHRDFTSVACVEDKCYVMTYNEYCRYRKFLRMIEQNVTPPVSVIPDLESGYYRQNFLPKCRVAPDRVFLCRRVYESRQRRLLKNPV